MMIEKNLLYAVLLSSNEISKVPVQVSGSVELAPVPHVAVIHSVFVTFNNLCLFHSFQLLEHCSTQHLLHEYI